MLYLLVVRVFGRAAEKWYYLLILGWGEHMYMNGRRAYTVLLSMLEQLNPSLHTHQHQKKTTCRCRTGWVPSVSKLLCVHTKGSRTGGAMGL